MADSWQALRQEIPELPVRADEGVPPTEPTEPEALVSLRKQLAARVTKKIKKARVETAKAKRAMIAKARSVAGSASGISATTRPMTITSSLARAASKSPFVG